MRTQHPAKIRFTSDPVYYGQYILGGVVAMVVNALVWHAGLRLYIGIVVIVAACIFFDRRRRATSKAAYRARLELRQHLADREPPTDEIETSGGTPSP
jgi:hypothetical protein